MTTTPLSEPRRIDHLVHATLELDRLADFYRRAGFTVGARNRHPWGTENHVIQFANRSFLEPIAIGNHAVPPPMSAEAFSFGSFVADYLTRQEGLAMLAMASDDAAADRDRFAAASRTGKWAPFHFSRTGRRADGSETTVAFTLAFARLSGAADLGLFTCQQHHPENFWSADLQRHANTALGVTRVVIAADKPLTPDRVINRLACVRSRALGASEFTYWTDGGAIVVMSSALAVERYAALPIAAGAARLVAFHVAVADLEAAKSILRGARIAFAGLGRGIAIPREAAYGATIVLEPAG